MRLLYDKNNMDIGKVRVLVLDPFQHFPSIKQILASRCNVTYLTVYPKQDIKPYKVSNNKLMFFKNYKFFGSNYFNPAIYRSTNFDFSFLIYPINFETEKNFERISIYNMIFLKSLDILDSKSNAHHTLIDNSDYSMDSSLDPNVSKFNFDRILKREMRTNLNYSERISPFPFVIFGKIDPLFLALNRKVSHNLKENKLFWSGNASNFIDPKKNILINRQKILKEIRNDVRLKSTFIEYQNNFSFSKYIKIMNNYKAFLVLNGIGHLTKRFFEGIYVNSIPLLQKFDLRFPESSLEFVKALDLFTFQNNDDLSSLVEDLLLSNRRDEEIAFFKNNVQKYLNINYLRNVLINFI